MDKNHFTDDVIDSLLMNERSMTQEERSYLVEDVLSFEENTLDRQSINELSNQELMMHVVNVWSDYCRSMGL